MSSLLCVKNLRGSVEVHDKAVADDLQTIDTDYQRMRATFMPRCRQVKKKPPQQPVTALMSTCLQHSGLKDTCNTGAKSQNCATNKNDEERARSLHENNVTQRMYAPLMEAEGTFVHDHVGKYLDHADMLGLRKRELLHKSWNEQVYEPMRHKIIKAMNGQDWTSADRRRRELYGQFLEHVNRRGHVFLDTMDPREYYAQALNGCRPGPITVYTGPLKDPLLAQERERNREDQVILRCSTGNVYSLSDIEQIKLPTMPLVPLGRHGTNSMTWLEMPLGNIESTPRKASRLRMKGNCTESQIDFAKWSRLSPETGTFIADQEMQLQKKRLYKSHPPLSSPRLHVPRAPFACSEQKEMCPVSS